MGAAAALLWRRRLAMSRSAATPRAELASLDAHGWDRTKSRALAKLVLSGHSSAFAGQCRCFAESCSRTRVTQVADAGRTDIGPVGERMKQMG